MEELDLMYKELAAIEKKIAELDSQLYNVQPGSKEIKELGKQLSGLENQFAAVVNKIIATENKLVASSAKASQSLVSVTSSEVRSNDGTVASVEQVLASRNEHIARLAHEESALRQLSAERGALEQSEKNGSLSVREAAARRSELIDKEMVHRQASSGLRVSVIAETNALRASGTLVGELSVALEKVSGSYREMSDASENSGLKELSLEIREAGTELSGYDKLMEGIGNHIPMLADEIRRVMGEYEKYKGSLKEGTADVGKAVSPWKQLTSSIFSWQSALAVGVVLLVTYWKDIVNFGKGLFGVTQEQEGLTESMIEFNKQSIKETRSLRDTYSAIMETNQGTEERKTAIEDMNTKYGKYLPHLLTEKSSLDDINAAYETVNKSLRANTALKMQNSAIDKIMEKAILEQAESLTEMRSVATKAVGEKGADGIMDVIPGLTEDFRQAGYTWEKAYQGVMDKIQGDRGGKILGKGFSENLESYIKNVYDTERQVSNVEKKYKPFVNDGKPAATYDHEKEAGKKKEAEREAREEAAAVLKAREELRQSLLANEMKMQADRLTLEEEGKNKRLKSLDKEHDEAILRIGEEENERMSRPGITDDEITQVRSQASALRLVEHEKLLKATTDLDNEYKASYAEHMKSLSNILMNEEERKLSTIKERYDKERAWADGQLNTGGMTKEQHQSFTNTVGQAEMKENYAALLGGLNDFKQKEADLKASWNSRIEKAEEAGDTNLAGILATGRDKALSGLHSQMLQESAEWVRLFGNLDTLTVNEMDQLLNSIQQKMESEGFEMNPVDTKAAMESLKNARDIIAEKSPFRALADSSGEMKAALAELKQAEDNGLTGAALDVYKNKVKSAADNVRKSITTIASAYGQVKDVMKSVSDLIGMVDGNLGETINNAISLGDSVMNVGSVVADATVKFSSSMSAMGTASVILLVIKAVITAVMAVLSLFNSDKKHEKKIQGMQKEVDELGRAYDRLGRAIENTYSDTVYGMMDDQAENLKRQQELVLQQMEEEEAKKKTDDKKVQEYKDKYEDLGNQAEDLKKQQIEMLAGTDVQSAIDEFADALVEAYAQGENGAEAMGEVTKKVLANAVKEALKKQLLGDALKNAVTRLGEDMEDGSLSDADKQRFEYSAQSAGQRFMEAMKMYDELFKGEGEVATREATAQGIASMSQESADLLNGQFTTQLIYLDRTCTEVTGIREQMIFIRDLQIAGWEDVKAIRDMSGRIAELSDRIANVSDKIEINTGWTARGIQDLNDKGVLMRGR